MRKTDRARSGRQVVYALAFLIGLGILVGCQPAIPPDQVWWDAPDFELTDERGQAFSSDMLEGKVWVAAFIYTHCTDTCPTHLSPLMHELQTQLMARKLEDQVQMVSITVDPARDTPEVLAEYAARYSANPRLWHFLTGPERTIQDLMQDGFKVGVAFRYQTPHEEMRPAVGPVQIRDTHVGGHDAPATQPMAEGDYHLAHSDRILLIDRHGKIRTDFDSSQTEVQELVRAVQQLLREK